MTNKEFAEANKGKLVKWSDGEGIVRGYFAADNDVLVTYTADVRDTDDGVTSEGWITGAVILDTWEGNKDFEWIDYKKLTVMEENRMPPIEAGHIIETYRGFELALPSGNNGEELRLYNENLGGGMGVDRGELLGIYIKASYLTYSGFFATGHPKKHLKAIWTKTIEPVVPVKTEEELKVEKLKATIEDALEQIKVIEGE